MGERRKAVCQRSTNGASSWVSQRDDVACSLFEKLTGGLIKSSASGINELNVLFTSADN